MNTFAKMIVAILACGCGMARAGPCAPIDNVDAVADRKVIIVGELHGTEQVPRFVSSLTCQLLARGKPVVLAIEMFTSLQDALDAAMASTDEPAAAAKLESLGWFDSRFQDGKRSVAWLEMLKSAWRFRQEHPGFALVAIDALVQAGGSGKERDANMAQEIRKAVQAHPDATLVVYTGNVHSRRTKGMPWNADFVPAAAMLDGLDVVSLDMDQAGGKAWNCTRNGCGVHEVAPGGGDAARGAPAIRLGATATSHDGTFDVGVVSASLPLRPPK